MSTARQILLYTEAEYLEGEKNADIRHEYIDGRIYAMSGAKAAHNRIAGNIFAELRSHLKGKPCQPYTADMKVRIGSKYFYPDVMVDCSELPDESYFTETPVLLVEVLSRSTRRMDETVKRAAYMQIPTLQEYLLIEQDFVDIEIIRRSNQWRSERFYLGDSLTLESVGLTLSVEEIYDRVQNTDMTEWLEQKAREALRQTGQDV
jgi:Uma2 family endonuclease